MDRVDEAEAISQRFLHAAQTQQAKEVHRALRPLLGQEHRQARRQFSPLPAVLLEDGTFAPDSASAQERWRNFFAQPEGGIPVTTLQLQELARLQTVRYPPGHLDFDQCQIPTLGDLEDLLLKAKLGKAPGLDGLPAELFRLHPPLFAQCLWPLMAKCAIRCTEPLVWRGGEIVALPKTHTISYQADKFRSIVLSTYMSKVAHGNLRARLLPFFLRYRDAMHAGGVPRLSTDMLHLFVNAYALRAKQNKFCAIAVFIDVQQAFYRALRPLILQQSVSDDYLLGLFQANGWSPDLLTEFRLFLDADPALVQAQVPALLQAQLQAVLSTTWFMLKNQESSLTSTITGTRPGDSLADLLYGFLMVRFTKELHARLVEAGHASSLRLDWVPGVDLSQEPDSIVQLTHASWVDDLVLLAEDFEPERLLQRASDLVTISYCTAAQFGLKLNLQPDKTSVVLALRGASSRKTWTSLLAEPHASSLAFDCPFMVRPEQARVVVLPDYIYLGALQDLKGHPAAEVHRRFLLAIPAMKMLRRNVFRSPYMPARTKLNLFHSMVLSRLLYGAGAWMPMHAQTIRSWHRGLMRMLAEIAPTVRRGPGTRTLDILADCCHVPPLVLLMKSRISLFDRLCQIDTMEALFAVVQSLQGAHSWLSLVYTDVEFLLRLQPEPTIQAMLTPDMQQAAAHSMRSPRVFTKLYRQAQRHYLSYLQLWKSFRQFLLDFNADAAAFGVVRVQPPEPPPIDRKFECPECGKTFESLRAMGAHAFQKHRAVNLAQRYTSSNVCRACLRIYDHRDSVLHHLKYFRTGCLLKLITLVPPLDNAQLQAVQHDAASSRVATKRQHRRSRHRWPPSQAQGPLRPWPWTVAYSQASRDLRPCAPLAVGDLELWIARLRPSLEAADIFGVLAGLNDRSFHGMYVQQLLEILCPADGSINWFIIDQQRCFHEALLLWQDNSLLLQLLTPWNVTYACFHDLLPHVQLWPTAPDGPAASSFPTAQDDLLEDTWIPARMAEMVQLERRTKWTWPQFVPRPFFSFRIFLYVFSGRRRPGDYQSQVEQLLKQYDMRGHVLMLDLALSDSHDVTKPALVQQLLRWIAQRAVVALLIAPPCETWSEARHLPGEVRPLRDHLHPFGLEGLVKAELQQLWISSYLLFVSLRLFMAATIAGTASILEHPREPKLGSRASIWRLPWVIALLQHPHVQRHLVWQARFGSPAAKPTHLMVAHIPRFTALCKPYQNAVDWQNLTVLSGKDATGAWKTSAAKEYPPALNGAFAACHVLTLQDQMPSCSTTEDALLSDIVVEFDRLAIYSSETGEMQPDFARRRYDLEEMD